MIISVIVPIYKVEPYLDRCIESIVNQTYRDLEIILVDDGSPDRCPEICDEWAKRDSRIKVIHQVNSGVSAARNAGLKLATGEYIGFVDSDDWIAAEMYEILFAILQDSGADIVECLWQQVSDSEPVAPPSAANLNIELYPVEDALALLMLGRKLKQTVVNKLYRAKVISGIYFPVGRRNEDDSWAYQAIGNCKKVAFVDLVLYYYFQRSDSFINSPYSLRRLDGIEAFAARLLYVRDKFPSLVSLAARTYAGGCRYHYQVLTRLPHLDSDGLHRQDLLQRYYSVVSEHSFTISSFKQRLWWRLFHYFPVFTSRLRNLLRIGL